MQVTPERLNTKNLETLVQILENTMTKETNAEKKKEEMVPYSKLQSLGSSSDNLFKWIGWISACITGLGMPSFVFLMGEIIDSMNPNISPKESLRMLTGVTIWMIGIGAGIWIFTYFMYSFLIIYSERVAKKTRVQYLRAILNQESAWFDLTNPLELSARIGKECLAIQKALGEKFGTIIMALSMCVSGLGFAFTRGWSFSLVIMAYFPIMAIVTGLQTAVVQQGFSKNLDAYAQSAGYAEQALNAIKVVTAFG